ncbi:MAG TPA: diacylglycerol kinase family protein [Cytophagaceae bacterium]|nr:diacylglycerol kinase family protein [Cytophagaceae bacterium]
MIAKTLKSFKYAIRGVGKVIRYENNAKVHLLATITVIVTGFFLRISFREWCLLVFAIALVWITETINTAIEKLVDLVSPEYNEKAGAIKDIAAAAVLMASVAAVVIGGIVFYNYI